MIDDISVPDDHSLARVRALIPNSTLHPPSFAKDAKLVYRMVRGGGNPILIWDAEIKDTITNKGEIVDIVWATKIVDQEEADFVMSRDYHGEFGWLVENCVFLPTCGRGELIAEV